MLKFETVSALKQEYPELALWLTTDAGDINSDQVEEYAGGAVYVVQSEEDVAKCEGIALNGELSNLAKESVTADINDRVNDDWFVWWFATSNAGGNVYFIPAEIRVKYASNWADES